MADRTGKMTQGPASKMVSFKVIADADPQILPRILGAFARFGHIPAQCHARLDGSQVFVEVRQDGMAAQTADRIADRMRSWVGIEHVELSGSADAKSNRRVIGNEEREECDELPADCGAAQGLG